MTEAESSNTGLMPMGESLGSAAPAPTSHDVGIDPTDIRLVAGGTAGQPCGKSAAIETTSPVHHAQENAHVSN
jgi:hypothetical protein